MPYATPYLWWARADVSEQRTAIHHSIPEVCTPHGHQITGRWERGTDTTRTAKGLHQKGKNTVVRWAPKNTVGGGRLGGWGGASTQSFGRGAHLSRGAGDSVIPSSPVAAHNTAHFPRRLFDWGVARWKPDCPAARSSSSAIRNLARFLLDETQSYE